MSGDDRDASAPLPARIARLMALALLIGAGVSALLTLTGNMALGLKVCAGSAGLGLVILVVGGWLVAANRPER